MIYIGTVTRINGAIIYVTIPNFGVGLEIGALQMVVPNDPTILANTIALATGSGGTPTHTHAIASHTHTTTNPYYSKGDRVVVAQIGEIRDNLIVIGKVLV